MVACGRHCSCSSAWKNGWAGWCGYNFEEHNEGKKKKKRGIEWRSNSRERGGEKVQIVVVKRIMTFRTRKEEEKRRRESEREREMLRFALFFGKCLWQQYVQEIIFHVIRDEEGMKC
jgi:hypothetical protein